MQNGSYNATKGIQGDLRVDGIATPTTDTTEQVNNNQHIDLGRIRKFFDSEKQELEPGITISNSDGSVSEYEAIRPMVLELCDLVENTGLLQDAQAAREQMEQADETPAA